MEGSIILGWILVALGGGCIVVGIVIGVIISLNSLLEREKKSLLLAIDEKQLKIVEIIIELLKEMLKYPGGIFFVVGLILISSGVGLLIYKPF